MTNEDLTLPEALEEAHALGFFEDHDGHDFEPDDQFDSSVETIAWWRAWTGNAAADAPPFRVFGRDGSGGLAAFWTRVPGAEIENQPMVFLGSEGELKVLAQHLGDYLWLLAAGIGPLETVDGVNRAPEPIPALVSLAQRHTGAQARTPEAVIAAADAQLLALTTFVESVVR